MPKIKRKLSKEVKSIKLTAQKRETSIFLQVIPVLFLGFWLAFCALSSTFPGYSWMFPFHYDWRLLTQPWQLALILIGLMFFTAWFFRQRTFVVPDIPVFWARLGLFVLFSIGVFLCTYHLEVPAGNYGDDPAYNMYELRPMNDLSDYRDTLVYKFGLLPIWPYVGLLLWHLIPGLHDIVVQRLTNSFFDLATILILYQIGKEIASRRLGLYCAAVGVVGKALLFKVISGFSYTVLPFSIALVFWATMRLFRKDASHPFLWWGVAVGLAAYSSFPIQPFIAVFIFSGLILVWWENRATMKLKDARWTLWVSILSFICYAFYCTGALHVDGWLWVGSNYNQPIASCILLMVALILVICYLTGVIFNNKKDLWTQWLFAAWLIVLISFPVLTHNNIIERIREHGWVQGSDFLSSSYISIALQHFPETIRALFWQYLDRPDMGLFQDPFFGYTEMILICLGTVFCLVKWNGKRIFILSFALLGLAPHFFAGMVHSGILLTCLIPFWIVAAIGLEELTGIVCGFGKNKPFWVLFGLGIAVFILWSAAGTFSRVHTQWADKPEDILVLREKVLEDVEKGYRIYFSDQAFYRASDVIYDGYAFHLWKEANRIDVASGEKAPSVAFFMVRDEERKVHKSISDVFPRANWIPLYSPLEPGISKAYCCEIDGADILAKKNKLLMVHPVTGDFWQRTCGIAYHGLNFSGISWQDEASDANAANPDGAKMSFTDLNMKLNSTLHMTQSGKYQFICNTGSRTILTIDGQKLFDLRFPRFWNYISPAVTQKALVNLEKGDHQVEVITYFQADELPNITLKVPGSGEVKSLWSGFSF
jgi:hypothetical protein